jgi:phage shock protein C
MDYKEKRLYRSNKSHMLCGVCGGIAEYFEIDPTLVRLAWVILSCFAGSGLLVYIVAAIVIPKADNEENEISREKE